MMVRARMGALGSQAARMRARAARPMSWAVQEGASSRFWRQMSRKPGSRMVTWTVEHFMPCFRSRMATLSERRATPVRISAHPTRFRRKVMPFPTDLGGGVSPARVTRLCSSPAA